jgi:hypothetical protein
MQPVDSAPPVFALTLQGANTVMELRGRPGPGAAAMLDALLRAVVAGGARHAIVDLSEAEDVPADVDEVLARTRVDLRLLGGRLLVVGQEELEAAVGSHLLEAFAAYREVLGPRQAGLPPSATANTPSSIGCG